MDIKAKKMTLIYVINNTVKMHVKNESSSLYKIIFAFEKNRIRVYQTGKFKNFIKNGNIGKNNCFKN